MNDKSLPKDLKRIGNKVLGSEYTEFANDVDRNSTRYNPKVELYFENLEDVVCRHIEAAESVVGCVAWLTSPKILDALASVKFGVSIVVQKEDFLRPDMSASVGYRDELKTKYNNIKTNFTRYAMGELVRKLSMCGDNTIDPMRCVGNNNYNKLPAFPRMHNKFLVFGKSWKPQHGYDGMKPNSVWTGSFNFTKNSTNSFENAVVMHDPLIAKRYFDEWQKIISLSEPLDWESEWCAPEWRIGS